MKLTHPATGQVIEVDAEQAETYISQGWEPPNTRRTSDDAPTK